MQELVREYLNELKKKQKKRRRIRIIVAAFALVVAGGVIWSLTQAGIAMTGSAKCGMEEHTHGDECYTDTLACGQEESAGHTHTDACWQTTQMLVCGQEESEEHVHAEACYQAEQTLVCGQEECAGHAHTEACYSRQLVCGRQEHIHTDACFTDNSADVEDASKWAAQYEKTEWKDAWGEDLVIAARQQLDYKESVANYIVTEDGSHKGYTRYGQFAGDSYIDWDASFVNFCMYYAGLTESGVFPDEKKAADWYDKFVGAEEGKNKVYLAAAEGYEPKEGDLIFTRRENEETDFQMGIVSSYDIEKNEIKVIEGNSGNQVKENTYAATDRYILEYLKISELEQEYKKKENETAAGDIKGENTETEEETDAGEESPAGNIDKVYTDGTIIVRASYNEDAEIPAEAELIAEQITAEEHEEHYAERESEFRETLENENATIRALLKIGFYVDGKEVEPKSPVTITVQFLDENGLAEGKPVTIVHFADQGAEVLDGSKVDNNSTTFRTDSFSEFAIADEMEGADPGESRPIDKSFEYEDEVFHISFHVTGNAVMTDEMMPEDMKDAADAETAVGEEGEEIAKKYQFKVKVLDEDSEEYQAFAEYAEETNEYGDQLLLQTIKCALYYDNKELDLSDCELAAEITPKTELKKYIPDTADEAEEDAAEEDDAEPEEDVFTIPGAEQTKKARRNLLGESDISGGALEEAESEVYVEDKIMISTFGQLADGEIDKLKSVAVSKDEIGEETSAVSILMEGTAFASTVNNPANPHFTVEYYADIPRIDADAAGEELAVIDTTGNNMPTNAKDPQTTNIVIDENGNVQYKDRTDDDNLTPVYKSKEFDYYKAPTIMYIDRLIENSSYTLKEVWIQRKDETSWSKYVYNCDEYKKGLYFTNCEENTGITLAQPKPDYTQGYIEILEGTKIRLVYNTTTEDTELNASFYDYDISDGPNTAVQVETKRNGINSDGNYTGYNSATQTKYAFGNANAGTDYGRVTWNGNALNAANNTKNNADRNHYMGCTFNMVTGLTSNKENVVFADGICGPQNLFGSGDAAGKSTYGGKLTYKRDGDTYTLSIAEVLGTTGKVTGMEKFGHPGIYDGVQHKTCIWTNNFWPMDDAPGTTDNVRKDPKFGGSTSIKGSGGVLPPSDDGIAHNSYFGMSYQVDFELDENYIGPLEYNFFGDDDMWVFLSPNTTGKDENGKPIDISENTVMTTQLVCDIGGVHSTVGEKVDLRDYLPEGSKGSYTLSFFYTERGASGSTCWMQFTLPSVSSVNPPSTQKEYGDLRVEKSVKKIEDGNESSYTGNDEFSFNIKLTTSDGVTPLPNQYSYTRYTAGGDEIETYLVLRNGSDFTLKNGEYIIIRYIEQNAKYVITESESSHVTINDINYQCTSSVSKKDAGAAEWTEPKESGYIEGDIGTNNQLSQVRFTNMFTVYHLPSTGGSGIYVYMLSGVLILSAASLMTYRKKRRGVLRS